MALIHAFLMITLRASQIVSGLALTIFAGGLGLSAYFGTELHLADLPATHQFSASTSSGSATSPSSARSSSTSPRSSTLVGSRRSSWRSTSREPLGPQRARGGRGACVGRRHGDRRHAYRYVHVLVGGAFAGVAGACYSLSITPGWTAGDMLVERRRLDRDRARDLRLLAAELCLVGAYLFGALSALPFALQAHDVT